MLPLTKRQTSFFFTQKREKTYSCFSPFRVLYGQTNIKHKKETNLDYLFSPFRVLTLFPFVALLKATYAENSHIVLSSQY